MTRRFVASLLGFLTAASTAGAQEFRSNIMGGPATGTYIQLARDIRDAVGSCGMNLDVVESDGGLENFLAVRSRSYTHVGITRNDVLEYLTTFADEDPVIANAIAGMRVVMPLHDEVVQVVAGREVQGLDDLNGLRVGIGPQGSASFLTSSLVLDLSGVEPGERVAMAPGDMRTALLAGELDAVMYVAGLPTGVFASPDLDTGEYHMVPIQDATLEAVYRTGTIPGDIYPFQDEPVATVKARGVLVTYDYDPSRSQYHERSCDAVSDIAHLVSSSLDDLRESGHPAWQTVDLDDVPSGWEVSACAAVGLSPFHDPDCEAREAGSAAASAEGGAAGIYRELICNELGGC